jgi:hypothetical protein
MAFLVGAVWAVTALPFLAGAVQCPTARLFRFPCPGCGMSRAFHLLLDGRIAASLAMHPLAVPTALSQVALAVVTMAATSRFGAPWALLGAGWGRLAVAFFAAVLVLDVVLWVARMAGAFGGPVPV